jgi:hypothetical protein
VLRGLKRRLDRLWVAHQRERAIRDAASNRHDMREAFVAALRAGLTRAGIDPASLPVMRRFDPPETAPPEPAARPPGPLERLHAELSRIARACREHPPVLTNASPIELFAMYCFDDGG